MARVIRCTPFITLVVCTAWWSAMRANMRATLDAAVRGDGVSIAIGGKRLTGSALSKLCASIRIPAVSVDNAAGVLVWPPPLHRRNCLAQKANHGFRVIGTPRPITPAYGTRS